ncbi:MAG: hypothetical protein V1874_07745 [Spirochaetota bacterium]
MAKRKKLIIDKKFQFKTIFKIIGVVYSIIAIVVIAIVINAASNNKKLSEIMERQKTAIQIQKDVQSALRVLSKEKNWKTMKLAGDEISKNIEFNLEAINKNSDAINSIAQNNSKLLYGIILFSLVQAVVMFFLLIRTTHQISGPIYHISAYIREIINGKYPDIRPLRKNDELKEFHELFAQMVESLKQKKKRKKG